MITTNFRESYGPGGRNQADHIAVGRACLEALGGPMSDPAGFLAEISEATGARLGTRYAASFEVFPLG